MIRASASEAIMRNLTRWIGALFCLSIFLRACFYIAYKLHVTHALAPIDFIAALIGLVCLYLSCMYFKKIFFR
jgi:hypothetical protein